MVVLHRDKIVIEVPATAPMEEWLYYLNGLARAFEVSTYSDVEQNSREEIGNMGRLFVAMLDLGSFDEDACQGFLRP